MIPVKSPKPEHPGKVARGVLASARMASRAFAFPAAAAAASEADEEAMSPEMKEMHWICATMMHGADQHQHHGEGRQ